MATSSISVTDLKILDGGLGSELARRGYQIENEPLWSTYWVVKEPRAITSIHAAYLENGADIIETSTYQSSLQGLCQHFGMKITEAAGVIKQSVTLAREARDKFWDRYLLEKRLGVKVVERDRPLVAGAIGPYGAYLADGSEYNGSYVLNMSLEELKDWHRPRMAALIEAGVDLLAMETIPAAVEGLALLQLLREFPNTKAWLSFSCKDGSHTSHGDLYRTTVKKCVESSTEDQLLAIGVNCVAPDLVCNLLTSCAKERGCTKLVAYPNLGEEWEPGKGWKVKENLRPLSTYVASWLSCGASWIGGCCRVTPEDITSIREEALNIIKGLSTK